MLREGKVKKKLKGKDLVEVINDEHNTEILTELLGEEAVEGLREYFNRLDKVELTREKTMSALKILAKSGLNFAVIGKVAIYFIKPLLRLI